MATLDAPKWRRRKEARPREIVAAALEVFAERGFAAARLDDVAARAGVSKAALYLYFETKQDLFRAVVAEAVAPNLAPLQAAAQNYEGRLQDLARVLIPTLAHAVANPAIGGVIKLVIGESRNFPELARIWHDTLVARALGAVAGLVEKAQARGEVKRGDARLFALGLIAPVLMGVIWRETFVPVGAAPFDLEALAAQHVETALCGMLTDGAR